LLILNFLNDDEKVKVYHFKKLIPGRLI
jgi:hypothetical protein